MLAVIVVFAISGVLVYNRIRNLEKQNEALQSDLKDIHATLDQVLLRLPILSRSYNQVPISLETYSGPSNDEEEDADAGEYSIESGSSSGARVRRTVNATGRLDSSSNSSSSEEATKSDSLNPKIRTARKLKERERGKRRKLRDKILELKYKLELSNSRRRAAISDLNKVKLTSSTSGICFYYCFPFPSKVYMYLCMYIQKLELAVCCMVTPVARMERKAPESFTHQSNLRASEIFINAFFSLFLSTPVQYGGRTVAKLIDTVRK
jgi:hypothetical protein